MLTKILVMPQSEQRDDNINQLVQQLRASAGGAVQHRDSLPCKTINEIIQLDQTLANDKEYLARMVIIRHITCKIKYNYFLLFLYF